MAEFDIVDLSDDTPAGAPQWLLDIEAANFRTAHDTGANLNALIIWNRVRAAHDLEPLTEDDLWQRHADTVGWSPEELTREREGWAEFEQWQGLVRIRDAYQQHIADIEAMPQTNEEFFAQRRGEDGAA